MDLILIPQSQNLNHIDVACNGKFSHTFELSALYHGGLDAEQRTYLISEPLQLGMSLFEALFSQNTLARQMLDAKQERIVINADEPFLDAIPWEFLHGPYGYLGLDVPILRGLHSDQHIPKPDLKGISLHILAVPSNPIGIPKPLDIEGEWLRLQEVIEDLKYTLTLERVNPPALSQLRRLVANKQGVVIHFMGHGEQTSEGAVLQFEKESGEERDITARDFIRRVGKNAFLVTLNACVSAAPGIAGTFVETEFANLARALVKHGIPYALGMRFSIPDKDAKVFSRALYDELARGIPIEEALVQVRNELAELDNSFAVGIPVLYTSLSEAAPGFATEPGKPLILTGQPSMDVIAIPRAEEAFKGRVPELLALGKALAGDQRTRLLTIHGGGGQGKTALAREAVERFAHAWPGGVWAISLESLPSRLEFATRLANFLKISSDDLPVQTELERRVLNVLGQWRVLLVLDNAETLVEAVKKQDPSALDLVSFLREQLSGTLTGLLVTSRYRLGWTGEQALELGGLTPEEGARLFQQSTPIRQADIPLGAAEALSERVGGHPLALRLLGSAFDDVQLSLEEFIEAYEKHLVDAKDKYKGESHRHHSLYASIEISVAFLEEDLKALLSGLWIFEAPFLPETAIEIFTALALGDPSSAESETEFETRKKLIFDQLHILHSRGLLAGERRSFSDGMLLIYRLLPTMRPYVRQMAQAYPEEAILSRFGAAYARLVRAVDQNLDRGGGLVWLADHARLDFGRGIDYTQGETQAWYQNRWGRVLGRLGDRRTALSMFESAMEAAQGKYPELVLHLLINMALVYRATGQPGKALALYEQALPITREVGDRAGEAVTCFNMAMIYRNQGATEQAIEFLRQAVRLELQVQDPNYEKDAALLDQWERAVVSRRPHPSGSA